MRITDILAAKGHDVVTVTPDDSTTTLLAALAERNVGAAVVVGPSSGGAIAGIVSERDVVRGLTRHGADLLDMSVVAVMSRTVPLCSPGDALAAVMAQMTRTRSRHVPVVDGHGRLCGIVSIGDVVKHRLEDMELETSVLRDAYLTHH